MSVLIVENEVTHLRHLKELLDKILPSAMIVGTTGSVKSTICWLLDNESPDLIILNVDLQDGRCFEILQYCGITSPVIFMANSRDHAFQAFKYNSVDYIIKPVAEEELKRAVFKWQHFRMPSYEYREPVRTVEDGKYKDRFLVKVGQRLIPVRTADILFFSSVKSMTYMHTRCQRKFHVKFSLDELEGMLSPVQYCRVTRTHIVSRNIIAGFDPLSNRTLRLELNAQLTEEIIVSKKRSATVTDWLKA